MKYRRANIKGGTYFFTVNMADRKNTFLVDEFDKLRVSINKVKHRHPFVLDAMVVLPDHLHLMMTLHEGDNDFATRIMLFKSGFSRQIPKTEKINSSRESKRERGIWQRRYWEHLIHDETDFAKHVDYIHYNPVKHGYVERAVDWKFSTLHSYVKKGLLTADWGCAEESLSMQLFGER
ncbi:transposase [uncultured Cocleimonas sp.]|uniref:REP-associated tyrosine transposase n=1 Tax=uncultured Cocleimonas sp. TaxID=1051587 RepID=UPI002617CFFD|nr:transposase [uncultured Cocleimonas sp.]